MGLLVKVLKWIEEYFEETILVILLVVMSIFMFLNAVLRYAFSSGIIWADEVCRYSLVITAFLAPSYCIRKRRLLRMDSLRQLLPFKGQFVVETFINLLLVCFFSYYTYSAITTVQRGLRMGSETEILRIPLWKFYSAALLCFLLASIRSIQKMVCDLVTLKKGEAVYKEALSANIAADSGEE